MAGTAMYEFFIMILHSALANDLQIEVFPGLAPRIQYSTD
jgi:hypothetical protein